MLHNKGPICCLNRYFWVLAYDDTTDPDPAQPSAARSEVREGCNTRRVEDGWDGGGGKEIPRKLRPSTCGAACFKVFQLRQHRMPLIRYIYITFCHLWQKTMLRYTPPKWLFCSPTNTRRRGAMFKERFIVRFAENYTWPGAPCCMAGDLSLRVCVCVCVEMAGLTWDTHTLITQ